MDTNKGNGFHTWDLQDLEMVEYKSTRITGNLRSDNDQLYTVKIRLGNNFYDTNSNIKEMVSFEPRKVTYDAKSNNNFILVHRG